MEINGVLSNQHMKNRVYTAGMVCAVCSVALVVLEISITFLPDGNAGTETVAQWFALFNRNPLMGMRNLGLVNLLMMAAALPVYLALFVAHYKTAPAGSGLALLLVIVGLAVYYANNTAFAMLALSEKYAAADTASGPRLIAAGEALLALGKSHTAGTYPGFFVGGIGGILMNCVMLRAGVVKKITAIIGLVGFGFLFIYDSIVSFVPPLFQALMFFAVIGGVSVLAWYILTALEFRKLKTSRENRDGE